MHIFLIMFNALGFLSAAGLSVYRVVKNNLVGEERLVYALAAVAALWSSVAHFMFFVEGQDLATLNFIEDLGTPPLLMAYMLLLLYYRKSR